MGCSPALGYCSVCCWLPSLRVRRKPGVCVHTWTGTAELLSEPELSGKLVIFRWSGFGGEPLLPVPHTPCPGTLLSHLHGGGSMRCPYKAPHRADQGRSCGFTLFQCKAMVGVGFWSFSLPDPCSVCTALTSVWVQLSHSA